MGSDAADGPGRHRPPAERRRARRDLVVGAAVALLVVVVAGFAAVALHARPAARPLATRPVATQPVPSSPVASAARVVAIVGDDVSAGAPQRTWVAAAARSAAVQVVVRAAAGSGYLASRDGGTFVDLARGVPSSARLVVLFGGGRDTGRGAFDLLRAETRAIAAARDAAPGSRVVVVGPLVASGTATVRSTLRSAAALTDSRFVDPVAQRWLDGRDASGGERLTAAGRAVVAARLAAILRG